MVALGSYSPAIEIWDLDVVGTLEPVVTLGGEAKQAKKKSKKQSTTLLPGSHTGPVLGLSINPQAK